MKSSKKRPGSTSSETPLSAAEALEHCAEIESNGVEFYKGVLKGTGSKWIRKLAGMMVEAEQRHHDRFLQYAELARSAGAAEAGSLEPIPPELARLMSDGVFLSHELAEKTSYNIDERQALRMAIRFEENTVLLLGQIRSYVPREQRKFVDRVLKEEQDHQAKLESYWKKYFG